MGRALFCLAFGEVTVIILKSVTSPKQSNWLYIRMKHNIHEHQQQQRYNAQYKLPISLKTQWPRATQYIKVRTDEATLSGFHDCH